MATRTMTSPSTNTLTVLGPTKSVPMNLQMPLHLNVHAKSEPCSPSSLYKDASISPRCFIAESIQCIDKIDQMSSEELESKFHAWLNLDSPSGSDSRKCSFSVTSPDDMSDLMGDVNGVSRYDDDDDTETDLRRAKKKGTNLYGRPYCPGRPLSMKERLQIIEYHSSGMKVNAISKSLCISHGCVSKIITRYRLTGVLTPVSSPEHRKQRRRKGDSLSLAPNGAPAPASAGPSTTLLSPVTPPATGPASVPATAQQLSPLPQASHAPLPLLHQQLQPAAVQPMPQLHFMDHGGAAAAAAAAAALPPSMMYTDPTGTTYSFLQPVASSHTAITITNLTPAPSQLHALPHDYTPYYLYPTQ